jgi:hypothetical protein
VRFLLAIGLLAACGSALAQTPAERLTSAEAAFAEGVSLKGDRDKARPAFARAAAQYDALWNQGFRTPAVALNRSRAHRLAGDLPQAIAALHDGLAVARYSRPLQVELEEARAAVAYPLDGDLAAQCRPQPYRGVSTRMSPAEAWVVAGGLWLVACAAVARFIMTRNAAWFVPAVAAVCTLVALGGLWLRDARDRAESPPLLIASEDTTLRRGNASSYPARLDAVLPRGAEVRELSRRGGWVQVQLPGGLVGWLPQGAVLACER